MPSLNFTKFADKVEDGTKPITIRAKRKRPIKVGDTLHLFTGMRTKNCKRLNISPVTCLFVQPIWISRAGRIFVVRGENMYLLPEKTAKSIKILDGFTNGNGFHSYFTKRGRADFEGDLIVFGSHHIRLFNIWGNIEDFNFEQFPFSEKGYFNCEYYSPKEIEDLDLPF